MKFVSFNINGLRARPHQLEAIVEKHQPDVIGLQETKVHDDMFPLETVSALGYHVFYHGQKGHYGVALLTKAKPVAVRKGFPGDGEEAQRRMIMADIETPAGLLTVMNGYFPQGESRDHETKFPAKAKFYADLQQYLTTSLTPSSPVLIMGDLNISPTDKDIGIGENNMKRSKGFDDNRGLRIDLLLASRCLADNCISTGIDYDIRAMEKPSDHAPVWAEFKL